MYLSGQVISDNKQPEGTIAKLSELISHLYEYVQCGLPRDLPPCDHSGAQANGHFISAFVSRSLLRWAGNVAN